MTRITIDPITRIEGHLRVDCEVNDGKVSNAWSSGQMWRGIEIILKDRDPRDAWVFTQRICGVCTTVHAITSVRAVENALDMEIPLNAQYIRNMIMAAHGVHDHIVHFYHLTALDWVDIVSALDGDPEGAAKLGATLSDYKGNSVPAIKAVKEKLKTFVGSGQLGVYASGYWGHPAMKLPPDVNLLAATHYVQALEVQRIANKIVTVLGSKTPHIQNLAVGGVANPINPESQSTLTLERLYAIKAWIDELKDFTHNAMMSDVAAVGALYAEWTKYGAGITNYLSVPDMPLDTKGTSFELPGGFIPNGDVSKFQAITSYQDDYFREGVKESVKHSCTTTPAERIRFIPGTARPTPITRTSRTTASTRGSRHRPSTTNALRSGLWPTSWACMWPGMSRPSATCTSSWIRPARSPGRKSPWPPSTRPSAALRPARSAAQFCSSPSKTNGSC